MSFNMQMNIAKAIGIFAIVAGHAKWNIGGDFFSSGFWHVPLFFFIAGYFYNPALGLLKKLQKYLSIFYSYHFFYGAVTLFLFYKFAILYGKLPTFETLIIKPISSTPFFLSAPNWFLYQLAISIFIFGVIIKISKRLTQNNYYISIFFLLLAAIAIFLSQDNFAESHGRIRILIKTLITLWYIFIGWLYKNNLENKFKYNIREVICVILIQTIILFICGNKSSININFAQLHHNISALLLPLTNIYLVLFVSKLLCPYIQAYSFIDKVGRNTIHIMANHIFILFILNYINIKLHGLNIMPREDLSDFYNIEKYKYIYVFITIFICTYIGEYLKMLKHKLNY